MYTHICVYIYIYIYSIPRSNRRPFLGYEGTNQLADLVYNSFTLGMEAAPPRPSAQAGRPQIITVTVTDTVAVTITTNYHHHYYLSRERGSPERGEGRRVLSPRPLGNRMPYHPMPSCGMMFMRCHMLQKQSLIRHWYIIDKWMSDHNLRFAAPGKRAAPNERARARTRGGQALSGDAPLAVELLSWVKFLNTRGPTENEPVEDLSTAGEILAERSAVSPALTGCGGGGPGRRGQGKSRGN